MIPGCHLCLGLVLTLFICYPIPPKNENVGGIVILYLVSHSIGQGVLTMTRNVTNPSHALQLSALQQKIDLSPGCIVASLNKSGGGIAISSLIFIGRGNDYRNVTK